MTELGEHLKSTREEQKLSLDDIQARTKIQKRHLQAIENGQFQKLPGPFYTKAFVKSYAEAVGLNPETLFAEYGHELPKVTPTVESLPPRRSSVPAGRGKLWSVLPGLLVFLLVIGLLAVIWVLAVKGNDDKTPEKADTHDQNVEIEANEGALPDDEDDDSGLPESSNKRENHEEETDEHAQGFQQDGKLELTDRSGDTSHFTLIGTSEFHVLFTFTGESWLKIEGNSGKTYVNDGFSEGEEQAFDFSEETGVRIRIGSAPNMSMALNGEEVPLQPDPVAQTVKITFAE